MPKSPSSPTSDPRAQRANPAIVFEYASGVGTDSGEQGRAMWARVKGKTEKRPARVVHSRAHVASGMDPAGEGSSNSTHAYRVMDTIARPFYPLMKAIASRALMTSADLGQAMMVAAHKPPSKRVLEPRDINALLR